MKLRPMCNNPKRHTKNDNFNVLNTLWLKIIYYKIKKITTNTTMSIYACQFLQPQNKHVIKKPPIISKCINIISLLNYEKEITIYSHIFRHTITTILQLFSVFLENVFRYSIIFFFNPSIKATKWYFHLFYLHVSGIYCLFIDIIAVYVVNVICMGHTDINY